METTMTPAEFHAAFTRTLEQRPACEADLNPLKDFLLSHGLKPWTLLEWLGSEAVGAWQVREAIRTTSQHLSRHDAKSWRRQALIGSEANRLDYLNCYHPVALKVHLLLVQVEHLEG